MKSILIPVFVFSILSVHAQIRTSGAADSVVVKVGKSHIIVSIKDTLDMQTLRELDMQAIIQDAIDQVKENNGSKGQDSIRVFRFKKFDGKFGIKNRDDNETAILESLHQLEDELEWLRRQENYLNSGSEFDREELKRIIKERAERLKELLHERTSREKEYYDLDIEINKENDQKTEENHSEEGKKRTYQSTHFDLGTINYLSAGKFPDGDNAPYTLSPQGSIYFAFANVYRTRLANKMFLEWGLGLGGYYFRFQNDDMQMLKTGDGVDFITDTRALEYRKSKFIAHFIQASFIPVIDFGGNRRKPGIFDGVESASFRIGLGPYAGYRTDSYTKRVYKEDGEKQRVRDRDNFYLNNFRYGLRLQMGYREADLFFTYDLNNLFIADKGPRLNTFSFGVSF